MFLNKFLLAIGILTCVSFRATAQETSLNIPDLIQHRLVWMKDVAGYKYEHNRPVEDLQQEERVLEATAKKAGALGLDEATIRPFVQAQMDAAKALQTHYILEWKDGLPKGWKPAELSDVRAAIASESDTILQAIADRLKKQGEIEVGEEDFHLAFSDHSLSEEDVHNLYVTLTAIRLK